MYENINVRPPPDATMSFSQFNYLVQVFLDILLMVIFSLDRNGICDVDC